MYLSHLIRFGFRHLWQAPNGYLFESAAGGGTGAAAGSTSSAGATSGTSSPSSGQPGTQGDAAAAAGQSGTPASASTGTAPTGKSYTEVEYQKAVKDAEAKARQGYIPGHRLVEETKKREVIEASMKLLNDRVRVLMGIDPANQPNADNEKIKAAFFEMFGGPDGLLKTLLGEDIDAKTIKTLLSNSKQAGNVVTQHWDNHRDGILLDANTQIAELIGVEKLSDRQRDNVNAAFRSFVRRNVEADTDGFTSRYEAKDPQMIADFVKEFTEDFITPARRTQNFTPPRVPRGGSSRPLVTTVKLETPKSIEEAEDAGVKYMRDRGHLRGQDDE